MTFRVLIIGGTGQVGSAAVRALGAEPSCAEVVMVNRNAIPLTADPRLRQVIVDTAASHFSADVTTLAQSMVAQGDPVYGASCVGVGKGSVRWSEEDLKALEIGVVGGFARGCYAGGITRFALLSAVGSDAKSQQDDIGRAFVAEFISSSAPNGVAYLENGAMRQKSRALR